MGVKVDRWKGFTFDQVLGSVLDSSVAWGSCSVLDGGVG